MLKMKKSSFDLSASFLIFLLLAVIPFFGVGRYWLGVFIVSMYYVLAAMGWNLLAGYTGQISIAPAAFALIGAYTTGLGGLYLGLSPAYGVLAGFFVAGIIGLILGRMAFKLTGPYLALTTIAFAEILRYVVRNSINITRGNLGLTIPSLYSTRSDIPIYYTFLGVLVVVQLLLWLIINSRLGLYLQSIREDEVAARSRGINVVWWKAVSFSLSSAICGLAGGLYVHYLGLASPKMGMILESGRIIMASVFGGIGTLVGPLIGGFIVKTLSEYVREFGVQHMLLFGFLGIVIVRFFREGIYGFIYDLIHGRGIFNE